MSNYRWIQIPSWIPKWPHILFSDSRTASSAPSWLLYNTTDHVYSQVDGQRPARKPSIGQTSELTCAHLCIIENRNRNCFISVIHSIAGSSILQMPTMARSNLVRAVMRLPSKVASSDGHASNAGCTGLVVIAELFDTSDAGLVMMKRRQIVAGELEMLSVFARYERDLVRRKRLGQLQRRIPVHQVSSHLPRINVSQKACNWKYSNSMARLGRFTGINVEGLSGRSPYICAMFCIGDADLQSKFCWMKPALSLRIWKRDVYLLQEQTENLKSSFLIDRH